MRLPANETIQKPFLMIVHGVLVVSEMPSYTKENMQRKGIKIDNT
jgi:hypothetical protein